jgi:hypothetical protein
MDKISSDSLSHWKLAAYPTLMLCFYYILSIVSDPLKFNMMRDYIRAEEIITKNFFCMLNIRTMRSYEIIFTRN